MSKKGKKKITIKPRKVERRPPKEETTALGKLIRGIGSMGGSALGGVFGQSALGANVGTGLGGMVSRWLGQGDYTVTSNSLVNRIRTSGDIPNMHRNGQSVVVRHREYIGDVFSSVNFKNGIVLPLNPGLSSSFPWLAGIAQQYQEYTWKGMIFEFVSTSGDVVASSNTALGSVMMCTNYRTTAAPFYSKQQLLNEYFATDGKPSECFVHPIECDPKENPYNVQYVRYGAVPAGEDPKTYDIGTFYLATAGMQQNMADIGELWVTYEVELRKPIASSLLGAGVSFCDIWASSAPSATNWFNGTINYVANTLPITMTNALITFPPGATGSFLLQYSALGAGVALTISATPLVLVNCTNGVRGVAGKVECMYGTSGDGASVSTYITITDPSVQATVLPSFLTLSGASFWALRITEVPFQTGVYY